MRKRSKIAITIIVFVLSTVVFPDVSGRFRAPAAHAQTEYLPASMAIAGILSLEPRQTVTRVQRVRTVNGVPVGVHDAYLHLPTRASLTRSDLEQTGSLYALLTDRFGLRPAEGLESLGAVAATADDAAHLKVSVGDPLLLCERITLSERRQPIEYCVMRYVQTYRYTARINKFNQLHR